MPVVTIALLGLLFLLLLLLFLRPSAVSTPRLVPASPPPQIHLQSRHVSFSLVASDYSLSLPLHRSTSTPYHRRRSSVPGLSRSPQPNVPHTAPATPIDQFGRILPLISDAHPSPKPKRRLSASLRLSFTGGRRPSSASTVVHLDQLDAHSPSPPLQRTRFVNLFGKHSRSRTLSPPSTLKSRSTLSSNSSGMSSPLSPPTHRQTLVTKFKSIFKSVPPQPRSPIVRSKSIFPTISARFRRKQVARTQPYGPPWNAPMPVLDFTLSQHSLHKSTQTMSPSPQTSRRCSVTSTSPSQLSPRTFISELDVKLSLLQQQHYDSQ